MMEGKVNAALKFLTEENDAGVLPADENTMKVLKDKHPTAAPIKENSLLNGPLIRLQSSYFDNINEDVIKTATRMTKGAAGPSKLDAEQFKNMLVNNKYKHEGKELREQIALLARKLATTVIDTDTIDALVCCNLIPLNKNPGVRPIGVGEILRRIIGKAIGWTLKSDVQTAAGPLQVATGVESGAEAAIHAMRDIFESDDCEAVVLVDASNAFNAMNRQVALHNVQYLCPYISTILINYYRNSSRLIINNGKELLSQEGTTQGDNLAMPFYALSTVLMQERLRSISAVKQIWLADDATGAGTIEGLKNWWDLIISEGDKCGYYVNQGKSWIILKNNEQLSQAKEIFKDSNIKYTAEGKRHLGAVIGSENFRREYANKKIMNWCSEIEKLSEIAILEPQAAYSAYIHGQQHKFNYFLRTIPGMENYIDPLDIVINDRLLPAILGRTISNLDREIFQLPIRDGGLGIPILSSKAEVDFESSKRITTPLSNVIISQGKTLPPTEDVKEIRAERMKEVRVIHDEEVKSLDEKLDNLQIRTIKQNREKGASSWLSVLPLREQGFALTKDEFRDCIALRYGDKISNLPSKCACGETFDVNHAMNCKKGGFVSIRHNNIRDFEANLLKKVCSDVEVEPKLQPVNNDEARLDVRARGFWRPAQSSFFDIRVTNLNAKSQVNSNSDTIFKKHEEEKKRKYNYRVLNNEHGSFTPLVFSTNGGMGRECVIYHKHLAEKIASKTGQSYERVMTWIRCKLSFVVMRSALLCLRGSRSVNVNVECVDDFAFACDAARL